MHLLRIFAAGVIAGAFVAFAPACITNPPCGPSNCTGCCSASGECTLGNLSTECGANGGSCSACFGNQLCSAGICTTPGGGNGDGGTGNDGGTTDGGNPGGVIALDNLCASYAPAVCAYYVRCGLAETQAGCESYFGQYFTSDCVKDSRAALKDGRMKYNGDKAKACIDAVTNTVACDTPSSSAPAPECDQIFEGLVATNGTCFQTQECSLADRCSSDGATTCPGQCLPRIGPGGTFSGSSGGECQVGLSAYYTPGSGGGPGTYTCYTPVAANGSCASPNVSSPPLDCVEGYYCDSSSNVCKAKKAKSMACSQQYECASPLDCMNGSCQLPAGLNQTCSTSTNIRCRYDLFCNVPSGGTAGVCTATLALGGTCRGTSECQGGLYCLGLDEAAMPPKPGTCAKPSPKDATCSGGVQCDRGLYCDTVTAKCTTQKPAGSACSPGDNSCGGYSYCDGTTCVAYACEDPTP